MRCRLGFHNWVYNRDRRHCLREGCGRVQETTKAWCAPWRDVDVTELDLGTDPARLVDMADLAWRDV